MQEQRIGFLRAYGAFWKYYADFRSRTSKEAFWKAWLIQAIILLVLMAPTYYVYYSIIEYGNLFASFWMIPSGIYCIATFLPMMALIIRRLHDIDRHGCWFLLFLVPFAGAIIFFIMLSRPSAPFDVYPGRSGDGPYEQPSTGQPYAAPQNPYGPGQPYGQPNPYGPQPYGQPGPYPYAPVYPQMPLPLPRRFAPPAGGDHAAIAFVLSIIVAVCCFGYNIVSSTYLTANIDRYFDAVWGEMFDFQNSSEYYDYWKDYENWGGGSDGDVPWNGSNGVEPWNFGGGSGYGYDDEDFSLSDDELAAIEFVRNSTLEGFSEFTIEEVLLSRMDEDGLEWDCYYDEDGGGDFPVSYVYASGYTSDFDGFVYAEFNVYEDDVVELYCLMGDGLLGDVDWDLYEADALGLYKEWYGEILSKNGKSNGA